MIAHVPDGLRPWTHARIAGGFHHAFELLIVDFGLIEFGGHFRHGFEETQQKTGLHRVIHIEGAPERFGLAPRPVNH